MEQLFSMQAHEVIALVLTPWYGKVIAFLLFSVPAGMFIAAMVGAQNKPGIDASDPVPDDLIVTYADERDPHGIRYRQYAKDPLPVWASNVRFERDNDVVSTLGE